MNTNTANQTSMLEALARAALTAEQLYCYDEPDAQILIHSLTRCAEAIARRENLPESAMDAYRRAVFSEAPTGLRPLGREELAQVHTALAALIKDGSDDEDIAPALNALARLQALSEVEG